MSAYVPPHRRKAQQQQEQEDSQSGGPSPRNNNNNQHHNNRSRQQGRGGGRRGGGGGRGANHYNNKSRSPKRDGGRSRSPRPQHHNSGNNNNHHHNHNHQHHHHHYPHLTKEQLQHQKEQLHILTDAITRICCINLERRPDRWQSFQQHLHQSLGKKMGHSLSVKVERYNAVDGIGNHADELSKLVQQSWDATINAKWDRHISPPMTKEMSPGEVGCALSHIELWRELVDMKQAMPDDDTLQQPTMLILEDDALFYSPKLAMNKQQVRELSPPPPPRGKSPTRGGGDNKHQTPITYNHDFLTAFQLAWSQLPEDWDIWYLGFSDRGDRLPVSEEEEFHLPKPHHHDFNKHPSMTVQLFRPTYGFHTHAYVVTAKAAQRLLENLPVTGPLDVWLADNQWFDLKVYCSVVEGEGWKQTGAWLITQNRKAAVKDTDIKMSGRPSEG